MIEEDRFFAADGTRERADVIVDVAEQGIPAVVLAAVGWPAARHGGMGCGWWPYHYGSEGWGFESHRARNNKGRLTWGNAGRVPFKTHPLWTPGAPVVLVCFGIVCAWPPVGVLVRFDPSGS
jgi:hypothetical protein